MNKIQHERDGPPPRTRGDDRAGERWTIFGITWRAAVEVVPDLLGPGGGGRTADIDGSRVNQIFSDAGV